MNKIICDICGTVYPDTADKCPICGCPRDQGADTEGPLQNGSESGCAPEALSEEEENQARGIFDFDAVNTEAYQDTEDEVETVCTDEEPEEYEPPRKSHGCLIVFLVAAIVAMIGLIGFLFLRYIVPNKLMAAPETTAATLVTQETEITEATEPTVPCTSLVMTSGKAQLSREGQFWLIHATVLPADTTDVLTYVSANEAVATVNEEGRVTAVGEGETEIIMTCGSQVLNCPVVVKYEEETLPPETAAATEAEETEEMTEAAEETEATAEETEATEPAAPSDIVLKLKKSDISFGIRGVTFTLELDCDLEPEDVTWSSNNVNVARVDNGVITTVGPGITNITAEYNGQTVSCVVRCQFS